jgi:hypothetical protein
LPTALLPLAIQAVINELDEWVAVARILTTGEAETSAFEFGTDTYVFQNNGGGDLLIKLTGIDNTEIVLATDILTTP